MAAVDVPQQGQLVQVRERRWVVADVVADELPSDVLEPTAQRQHLLTLRCVDDDAEVDESIQVVWEIEPGARAFERSALPSPTELDDPRRFDAFLDAVRWGASSNADPRHYLAPFQSGVEIDWYQLDPLVRAIRMPRLVAHRGRRWPRQDDRSRPRRSGAHPPLPSAPDSVRGHG